MRPKQPLKEHIITVLTTNHYLTAPELLLQLEKQGVLVNKTSVYRALQQLINTGLVYRHTLDGSEIVYERHAGHHDHQVCLTCHRVESVACSHVQPPSTTAFNVKYHTVTFYGVCANCQKC